MYSTGTPVIVDEHQAATAPTTSHARNSAQSPIGQMITMANAAVLKDAYSSESQESDTSSLKSAVPIPTRTMGAIIPISCETPTVRVASRTASHDGRLLVCARLVLNSLTIEALEYERGGAGD